MYSARFLSRPWLAQIQLDLVFLLAIAKAMGYSGHPALHPCGAVSFQSTFKFAPGEFVEPSIQLNTVYTLSRRARSTTPAPLRFLDLKEGGNFR